jgi:anti-anti-sigma regulatory factor
MAEPRPRPIDCDAGGLAPDLAAVESLCRMQLGARRQGLELRISRPSPELRELLALVGLASVLHVEVERNTEQRE